MKNHFLHIAIILLMITGCKKENSDEFIPSPGNPYNDTTWAQVVPANAAVNRIFDTLTENPETASVDLAAGSTIHFANGLVISLPVNACTESSTGLADITVKFLGTKGDFIRNAKPSTSGTHLLVSGGAVYVSITQNATPLHLAEDKSMSIRIPTDAPDPEMTVFYGDTSTGTNEGFTWQKATDNTSRVNISQTDTGDNYELITSRFDWINCDRYLDFNGDVTTISVVLPVNFTNANTAVFLVSTSGFTVARFQADVANRRFYLENIPVGESYEVVTMSQIGSDLYLGTAATTIEQSGIIQVSPEKKTLADITEFLDGL